MERREFLASSVAGVVGTGLSRPRGDQAISPRQSVRAAFPRLTQDRFISAAAGTPLGSFAEAGMRRYQELLTLGPAEGRGEYLREVVANVGPRFAQLIGARPSEIGLVHCTKAGEQVIIDALDPGGRGRNIVTNDMHFSGSLHNLVGLRKAGVDVRIVRGTDFDVPVEAMADAIDGDTALVAITHLSNVTGRIERVRELSDLAHARGALLYADIIQSAGIVPLDMRALGIDCAATNGYKWLYGIHGAGFLYVREELQGTAVPDRLFPGHVQYNYPPWVPEPDPDREALIYTPPSGGARYQPGHVSYVAYCAVYEGLGFLERVGVDAALAHSVRLNQRLLGLVDQDRYRCLTPNVAQSPIITFATPDRAALLRRLETRGVIVSAPGVDQVRVSPAIYNVDDDIDVLAEVMNAG